MVKITVTDKQPPTFWNTLIPLEYKFIANVEPQVPHPRWSQASEWRLGAGGTTRHPTQLYNGYEKEVAGLYNLYNTSGMKQG